MSTLQTQLMKSTEGLSDENLHFLLDMIERFMIPQEHETTLTPSMMEFRKIGVCKPEDLYVPDYDIDEDNDEIARLFGEVDG